MNRRDIQRVMRYAGLCATSGANQLVNFQSADRLLATKRRACKLLGEKDFESVTEAESKYSISQIQLRINRLVEVLGLISSGAMNCAPTFEHEMLKPISRGAIHRVRSRPPSQPYLRNDALS